jgi:hypothetical protein
MNRNKCLTGVAVLVFGLGGSIFAQPGTQASSMMHKMAAPNMTASMACCRHADVAAAKSTGAGASCTKEERGAEATAKKTSGGQVDYNKSPYWEPKDWTYIYNQGS